MSIKSAHQNNPTQEAFILFQQLVYYINSQIQTDTLEWAHYTALCCSAENISDYAAKVQALAGDELDQNSWLIVKAVAAQAQLQDEDDALITVLSGFISIENPSHNSNFWSDLRHFAAVSASNLVPLPFQRLMFTVIAISGQVNKDTIMWGLYARVCQMALLYGVEGYIAGVQGLPAGSLWEEYSWKIVKQIAAEAGSAKTETTKIAKIFSTFTYIRSPQSNLASWVALLSLSLQQFDDGDDIKFIGDDTRSRRTLVNPNQLPPGYNLAFLVKKNAFPPHYSSLNGMMMAHLQYVMRLDQSDNTGAVYFLVTHSQDDGGYVGLAKIDAANVGHAASDNQILIGEPNFAGEMIWWDTLNLAHPGGCNHPGNGGQIGSTIILSGQDWTKAFGEFHVLRPVGKGSGVLFYDFKVLSTGSLPSYSNASRVSDAYLGRLTTQELNLEAGDDGELDSVIVEQGPDGRYFLICGNSNQTVLWASTELVPDIAKWEQLPIYSDHQLNDGSGMLAWAQFDAKPRRLYYVQAGDSGMNFYELKYLECDGKIIAVAVFNAQPPAFQTSQNNSFGQGNWASNNGSLYAGFGDGVALYGAFADIDDSKGPRGEETKCIQIRTWFTNPR